MANYWAGYFSEYFGADSADYWPIYGISYGLGILIITASISTNILTISASKSADILTISAEVL